MLHHPARQVTRARRQPIRSALVPLTAVVALGTAGRDWTLLDPDRRLAPHELEGRYQGSFVLDWDAYGGGARGGRDRGAGVVRIRRAFGSGFDGRWSWRVDGRWWGGGLDRGRQAFGGDVSFVLETGVGRDLLEELTGCRFLSGDRRFHGSVRGSTLRARRVAHLRCRARFGGRGEELSVRVSFSGRRSGFPGF